MNNITAAKNVCTVRRLQVFLTVVGCDIQALRGVYMIGWGFSLMIPSAEAARSTDDLRTTAIPGNGAEDGGWGQRDAKGITTTARYVSLSQQRCQAIWVIKASLNTEPLLYLEFAEIASLAKYQPGKTQGGGGGAGERETHFSQTRRKIARNKKYKRLWTDQIKSWASRNSDVQLENWLTKKF